MSNKKARAIMVQGTMSNAGKSLLAAGLCRIFKEDGFKVAPFKAQNMALNSFITKDGLEMGRAQVAQAEAAGVEPMVEMNPILLKPTNDTKSQVIVNGKVWQNMSAKEYYTHKHDLVPEIEKAYNKLADEFDIIVIEGAGSPAEINLKNEDIVNMFMARMANAPVLLAGDIDRGGVFASLAGTLLLFEPWEKDLVAGFIINKFRGDITILEPGLRMLEEITDKPVLGVVPMLDVDIDDEDSLSGKLNRRIYENLIDIVVLRIPRISNFTDFGVFETIDGVQVRYVNKKEDMGNPDIIMIPGTKNTMADLKFLRESGLEARITTLASRGVPVFGICGGYQMLGRELEDPFGVEEGGAMRGMGLLPSKTVFEEKKVRTRAEGKFNDIQGFFSCLSGLSLEGYEIHMGKTFCEDGQSLLEIKTLDGEYKIDGLFNNNVAGSYVHGVFDGTGIAENLVKALMKKKGIDYSSMEFKDLKQYKEEQYDKLSKAMRKALDMDKIYEILGIRIDI